MVLERCLYLTLNVTSCCSYSRSWNEFGPLQFHLPLFQAKGTLNCPGAIGRHPKGENCPFSPLVIYNVCNLPSMIIGSKLLTAVQVAKKSTEENKIKREIP